MQLYGMEKGQGLGLFRLFSYKVFVVGRLKHFDKFS